jgi:parvulin-like peptidyl-prolyl isomerase
MGILGRGPTLPERPTRRDKRRQRARPRPSSAVRRGDERRAQVILLSVVALVAVVVVGIGVFGYLQTNKKPKEVPVIRVGDRAFDMAYMERWLRYTIRNASVGETVLLDLNSAVGTALTDVANAELDRRGAPDLGISISEDEIDADIRLRLRIPETADATVFAEAYRNEVKQSGLSPKEYREVVAARLLEEKLRQRFRAQIPATAEQVRLRDIAVQQADLQKVLDRLKAGEDFAALAAEVSLDTKTKDKGGEMDWQARGELPLAAEGAVFSLEVGQVSDPVAVSGGGYYYLYQVVEKAADREVTTDQRQQIEEQLYSNWRAGVAQQFPVVYADGDTALMQKQIDQLAAVAQSEGVGAGGG